MSTCIDVLENQGSQYEKRNTGRNVVVDWNWKCQFKLNLKIKITQGVFKIQIPVSTTLEILN